MSSFVLKSFSVAKDAEAETREVFLLMTTRMAKDEQAASEAGRTFWPSFATQAGSGKSRRLSCGTDDFEALVEWLDDKGCQWQE